MSECEISHFHQVTPFLCRSAQPTLDQYKTLAKLGIRTVFNLRGEISLHQVELITRELQVHGIQHVYVPLIEEPPGRDVLDSYINRIRDSESRQEKVLVHCLLGRDRTGFFVASWRILGQKWGFDQAYEEMLSFGFHPGFVGFTQALKDYHQEATSLY